MEALKPVIAAVAAGRSLSRDEAADHFGWLAIFAGLDMRASSALTQARTGWHPTGPGLLADLEAMDYATAGR